MPELVCGYFPASEKASDTFIAGLSMGAYGAMFNYLRNPDRYGAAGCFSGAFEKSPDDEGGAALYALAGKNADKIKNIYLSCGADDFISDNTVNMHNVLAKLGIPHEYVIVKNFSHEWRFWDIQLENFIKQLPRSDAYAGKVRKV